MVKDEGNDPVLEGVGKYFLSFKNYSLIEDPVQTDEYLIVTYIPIRELLINRPAQKQFIPIHPNCSLVDVDKTIEQNIIKGIKQEFGEKGTFHLKSQGIKIIARTVEISDRDNRISIQITDTDNEGIIDGANLYNIIKDMKVEDVSKHSYIKLEVHVIKNLTIIDNIVESLDSKLVKRKTQIYLKKLFWLEEIVEETDYKNKIDLLEVLALINLFRSNYYDSEVNNQPTDSYWNKQSVIQQSKKIQNLLFNIEQLLKTYCIYTIT